MIPMRTKVCARDGCTVLIDTNLHPAAYASRKFCSAECSFQARGWKIPPPVTPEQRQRICSLGGIASGKLRRLQGIERVAATLEEFVTSAMKDALAPRDLARLKALLARAYRRGWEKGLSAGGSRRRKAPKP
jgi:hypothetical protein